MGLYISTLSSIIVGTNQGRLMVYDVKGDPLFTIQSDFMHPISCLTYSNIRNMLFASGKDGNFGLWKLPPDWWHYKED